MSSLREAVLARVVSRVRGPGRYVGGELNSIVKRHEDVDVTFCLAFPDTYAIGMSQTGLHILYATLNARDDVAAERAFAPWADMEEGLRREGLPLYSLETFTPLAEFDIVGFSLQYEMCCTNVLLMLDLGGVPLLASERGPDDPLIVAGGPFASNPEPMSDFIDLFAPGDGEEVVHDLVDAYKEARGRAASRRELCLEIVRRTPGVYAPCLYTETYPRRPVADGAPEVVHASVVHDLDGAPYPEAPIVPFEEIVHDRITLEIMRGCARGCRYCQAGMIRRPVRLRSADRLEEIAERSYRATGHSEISLASLSSSDYPDLKALASRLAKRFADCGMSFALPSLRVDDQLSQLPEIIGSGRKSGLTLAPEAATERLRRVINKDISDEDLFRGVETAFSAGWQHVKLYFMCGLPTETDEDVVAIIDLAEKVARLRKRVARGSAQVTVNVAPFVPKPHTPFQWEPMAPLERIAEIREMLHARKRLRAVRIKFHRPGRSFLEGVFSRGDRALGAAVREAYARGCRFDAWDETFDLGAWLEAFRATGIEPETYANAPRDPDAPLPWDIVSTGVSKPFLREELDRSRRVETTPFCMEGACQRCGLPACPRRDAPAPSAD